MATGQLVTNLSELSDRFNLPSDWIREQVLAGRIPCLRVGRRMLFNLDAVRNALAELAAEGAERREAVHA